MTTNRSRLVAQVLTGQAAPALLPSGLYDIGADGIPRILPSVGGITLNVRVGDGAFAFEADHVEPGVSVRHPDDKVNAAFCALACVGNRATVVSGEAKGERGVVTGKHGGVEHVLIDFPERVMERMQIGDAINVRAIGVGLAVDDAGDVNVFNCDPDLLEKIAVERDDIQCFDAETVREFGLDQLRLGDLVAILDADNSFGRVYRSGAVTIAVVSHGGSHIAGHGPGVTTLMTSASGAIAPRIDARANLAGIMELR